MTGLVVAGGAGAAYLLLKGPGLPDAGRAGPAYQGAPKAPTSDKPQSKLWVHDGQWWGNLFDPTSRTWHIHRLDRAAGTWADTGTVIDDRPGTRADTLWDGTHLYVASHVVAASSDDSAAGQPARLYRFSYTAGRYVPDAGFPVGINDVSSESLTVDKDSRGVLWATWTAGRQVYVNATTGDDTAWGKPFVLPVTTGGKVTADDISALVAVGGAGRVGVMWSDEESSAFGYAEHKDGDPPSRWTLRSSPGLSEPGIADDHLALRSDGKGHVFAAVKTSLEGKGPDAAQILLLRYDAASGAWTRTTFGTVADCHTRPQVVLDPAHDRLHVLATAPVEDGCPHTGTPGAIYRKTTSLSAPAFAPGRGEAVIRDSGSAMINDATVSKQPVDATTGVVVLAGNDETKRYWFADLRTGT